MTQGVSGWNGSSAVGTKDYAIGNAATLTPDALMAYCQAQLGDIDSNVNTLMDQQDNSNKAATALSSVSSQLNNYPDGFHLTSDSSNSDKGSGVTQQQVADFQSAIDPSYTTAIAAANAEGDKDLANKLTTDQQNIDASLKDGCLSSKEISDALDNVKDAQSDITNNSQMAMIQLSSLMSQRQQAVQLISNMVQTINDTSKSAIANIHS